MLGDLHPPASSQLPKQCHHVRIKYWTQEHVTISHLPHYTDQLGRDMVLNTILRWILFFSVPHTVGGTLTYSFVFLYTQHRVGTTAMAVLEDPYIEDESASWTGARVMGEKRSVCVSVLLLNPKCHHYITLGQLSWSLGKELRQGGRNLEVSWEERARVSMSLSWFKLI